MVLWEDKRMSTQNRLISVAQSQKRLSPSAFAALAILAQIAWSGGAQATNLVANGNFAQLTGAANQFIGYGVSELVGWTYGSGGKPNAAVYAPGGAQGAGAQQGPGGVYGTYPLFGPGQGYSNGYVDSPAGGNFLAVDGESSYRASISQTITGLVVGQQYALSFIWAGSQFYDSATVGYTGTLTSAWQVSLGSQTFTTPVASYASHGFAPWTSELFIYTATSSLRGARLSRSRRA
jgi:hypothetical protein